MLLARSRTKPQAEDVNALSFATTPQWREVLLAFGLAYLFFLLLIPHFISWLNPPTGDEPFYLMTAQSIIADRDIDERNNYGQYDYWKFSPSCQELMKLGWGQDLYSPGILAPGIQPCPDPYSFAYALPPHFSQGIIRAGEYTKHGLGLSFLIAPAWGLGGRWLVMAEIAAFAALLGANVFMLACEMTDKKRVAWLCWLLMVFSAPLICFALLIFPATPAGLLVIYSWRRLRLAAQERIRARQESRPVQPINNPLQMLLIGICIGFLPWLHSVYLILSFCLALFWFFGGRITQASMSATTKTARLPTKLNFWRQFLPSGYSWQSYLLFFAPVLLFGALFLLYYIYYYGSPLPNTQDHAGFAPLSFLYNGLFGLLFDQKWGLLIYAPIYLLALAGVVLLPFTTGDTARDAHRRSDFGWLLVVIVPYYLVMADYKQWWGEWCPPARYLMPIVPLLALPLAIALDEIGTRARRFFIPLGIFAALWSGVIAVVYMTNPKLMYHWQDEKPAKLLTWLQDNVFVGTNLSALFPSYATLLEPNKDTPYILVAILWIIATVFIITFLIWLTRHTNLKSKN